MNAFQTVIAEFVISPFMIGAGCYILSIAISSFKRGGISCYLEDRSEGLPGLFNVYYFNKQTFSFWALFFFHASFGLSELTQL